VKSQHFSLAWKPQQLTPIFSNKKEEIMVQESIYWTDEYPKKDARELQSHATCIIDGYKWRVHPSGRTYCAGKVKEVK